MAIDADTGSQVNYVDYRFCRIHHIPVLLEAEGLNLPQLINPNGSRIKNHGIFHLTLQLTNMYGNPRTVSQFFYGVKRPKGALPIL